MTGQSKQPTEAIFEELPVVEAASLHAQALDEAPANVTIVSAAEIRKFGYRTLGEALNSVRGFYGVDDRLYQFFGARGINLPGDYNTRFLVMINGHPMTENIYASNGYFGQDFGLDMDMVERIEIIRGPTSALYGSNGMLANVNIVTKSPVQQDRARVSVEADSLGQSKAIVSTSLDVGKGRTLLLSASSFYNRGVSFQIPEFAAQPGGGRTSYRNDREHGYHALANYLAGHWNIIGYASRRDKNYPVPWAVESAFDDPNNRMLDERNFAGAMYSRENSKGGKTRWQTFYDQIRYRDHVRYLSEGEGGGVLSRDVVQGDWLSTQLSYQAPFGWLGTLTFGTAGTFELRGRQRTFEQEPVRQTLIDVNTPDRQAAVFVQSERKLSRRWTAHFGLRGDGSKNFGLAASPRVALVYKRSPRTTWKAVYGKAFRNPSAFEKFWWDGYSLLQPLSLGQESAHTFEFAVERQLKRGFTGLVNVYHYDLRNLIQAEVIGTAQRYRNYAAAKSTGVEGEIQGSVTKRLGIHASWAVQRAADRETGWLVNSPRHVAKARMAYDLVPQRLTVSGAYSGLSGRRTNFDGRSGPVHLFDATVSTLRLTRHFDISLGIRNATDARYWHPVAISVDRMPGLGRSVFVKLIARSDE